MQLKALTLPLYPALRYRRTMLDRLLLRRPRVKTPPLGRLETTPEGEIRVAGRADQVTVNLTDGARLQLSTDLQGDVAELALRIRPAGLSGRSHRALDLQTVLPAPLLADAGLPQLQTRAPYLTANGWLQFWTWLQRAADATGLEIPDLNLTEEELPLLESPAPEVTCIACNSVNVLGSKDSWRCLDCGYESDGLVNARREQALLDKLREMTAVEREEAALDLLTTMRSDVIAVKPDCVTVISSGDNKSGDSVKNRALNALGVLYQLHLDAELVHKYRPNTRGLDRLREVAEPATSLKLRSSNKLSVANQIHAQLETVLDLWPAVDD